MTAAQRNSFTDASTTSTSSLATIATTDYFLPVDEDDDMEVIDDCPVNVSTARDDKNYHMLCFTVTGVIMTSIVIIGIICNMLSIYLLRRRRLRSLFGYYMLALAIWDLTLLMSAWLMYSATALIYSPNVPLFGVWVYTYKLSYPVSNTTLVGCVWITLTLATERYVAVCYPLKHKTFDNRQRAKLLLTIVSVAAVLFSLPRFFETELTSCYNPITLAYEPYIQRSRMLQSQSYFMWYRVVGGLLCTSLLPFTILTLLTAIMLIKIQKASAERRRLQQQTVASWQLVASASCSTISKNDGKAKTNSKQNSPSTRRLQHSDSKHRMSFLNRDNNSSKQALSTVTETLIVVVIKFLICYTLPTIIDLLECVMTSEAFYQNIIVAYLVEISNLLVVCHSASNFAVYVIFGPRFRKEIILIFARKANQTLLEKSKMEQSGSFRRRNSIVNTLRIKRSIKENDTKSIKQKILGSNDNVSIKECCSQNNIHIAHLNAGEIRKTAFQRYVRSLFSINKMDRKLAQKHDKNKKPKLCKAENFQNSKLKVSFKPTAKNMDGYKNDCYINSMTTNIETMASENELEDYRPTCHNSCTNYSNNNNKEIKGNKLHITDACGLLLPKFTPPPTLMPASRLKLNNYSKRQNFKHLTDGISSNQSRNFYWLANYSITV